MRRLRTPSPSLVISLIALTVALGGTSYAAVTLKRNSVSSAHLKNNSVTSPKVKNGSLRAVDFGRGQLPAGERGPAGPVGAQGERGPQGERGLQGEQGPAGTPDTSNFFTKSESDGRFVRGEGRRAFLATFATDGNSSSLFMPPQGQINLSCHGGGTSATVRFQSAPAVNNNVFTDTGSGVSDEFVLANGESTPVGIAGDGHVTWFVVSGEERRHIEAWIGTNGSACIVDLVVDSRL